MTPDEMFYIARRLSNQCFTRCWLHWNYPQEPAQMALCCAELILVGGALEARAATIYEGDLPTGYTKKSLDGLTYYVWDKTAPKGETKTNE